VSVTSSTSAFEAVVSETITSTLSEVPPEVRALVTASCRQPPLPVTVAVLERTTELPLSSRMRSLTLRPAGARTQADDV
jgi:hypothetical protein